MQVIFNSTFLSNSFNYIENQVIKNLTPLQKKVAIFAVGCFSLIALSYFVSRCFCAKQETNTEDFTDWDDPEEQVESSDDFMKAFRSPTDLQNEEEIKALVEKKDFDTAWENFVASTTAHGHKNLSLNSGWSFLPPVELIQNRLDQCATAADILNIMPPEFVRDCLIAYPKLQQHFLTNDLLETLFNAYGNYITDICTHDKKFAKAFILSPHPKAILSDDERLNIFKAAYSEIGKAFNNNEIDIEAMKYFSLFLLNYRLPIPNDTYNKVKKLERAILKLKRISSEEFDERLYTLIKLVISKLNEQGIFNKSGKTIVDDEADSLQSTPLSTASSSDEIKDYLEQLCQ